MSKLVNLLGVFIISAILVLTPVKADSATGTNFQVSKIVTPTTTTPGSVVSYAITITNTSATNQAPQTVTDTLPAGFAYSGNAILTTVSGSQVTFAPATSGQTLTWTFDGDTLQSIPADQNIVISYQVTVSSTNGQYTNTACLTAPENVCAVEQVVVTTNPNTGIVENIFMLSAGAVLLIAIGLRLSRAKQTFEGNILKK